MELASLTGVVIVSVDFFITCLVFVSIGLTIWHIFDQSVGTDLDWVVMCIFVVFALVYNYCLHETIEFKWDRFKEYTYIIAGIIGYFAYFGLLLKSSSIGKESS